jgi:hypothetical protein
LPFPDDYTPPNEEAASYGGFKSGIIAMMNDLGGMMWGMGLVWVLVILVLVLGIAALVKYLRR